MNELKWWFRIVGGFYTLLGAMNLYFVLFGGATMFRDTIPFPVDDFGVQAFVDGWSPFAFEMLGIGTFLLWASRDPLKYLSAVYLIVWLELLHGVVDDIYLIARGYDAIGYLVFIVIHFAIIVTGIVFVRQAAAQPARLAAKGSAP